MPNDLSINRGRSQELCDNFLNKKVPSGNVSVICHKMLSVVVFLKSPFPFFAIEIILQASVSELLFVDHHVG